MLVAAAALTGCGGLGGPSEDDARDVVLEFSQAAASGDCPTAERLSTSHFQEVLGCAWLTAWSTSDPHFDVVDVDIDGDTATAAVDIDLFAYDGTARFDLVEVDGEWLVDYVDA